MNNLSVMQLTGYLLDTPEQLDATFAALADPTRRAILSRLAEGEATVSELAAPFAMSQPAISKHLKVLERAGLISQSIDAQRRPRRLEPAPLAEATQWLERYRKHWEQAFAELDNVLNELKAAGLAPTPDESNTPDNMSAADAAARAADRALPPPMSVAEEFAISLDTEDYEVAESLIAEQCRYEIGDTVLTGPAAIIASYRDNGVAAAKRFDRVAFESEAQDVDAHHAIITFSDIVSLGGKWHTYQCRQHLTISDQPRIIAIRHEEIPGQREQLLEFERLNPKQKK